MLTSTVLSICARKLCLRNLRLLCSTSSIPRGILNLKQKNGSISIDVREPVELQSISWENDKCRFRPLGMNSEDIFHSLAEA